MFKQCSASLGCRVSSRPAASDAGIARITADATVISPVIRTTNGPLSSIDITLVLGERRSGGSTDTRSSVISPSPPGSDRNIPSAIGAGLLLLLSPLLHLPI
mgnify:CR=1 FL=1|jgi:hypothetical protein